MGTASSTEAPASKGTILTESATLLFLVEEANGAGPEQADAELLGAFGDKVMVAHLRSPQWAERVRGMQELQAHLEATAMKKSVAQRECMFKAAVTVLSRMLRDKLVPVFLPSLQLLQVVFSANVLEGLTMQLT